MKKLKQSVILAVSLIAFALGLAAYADDFDSGVSVSDDTPAEIEPINVINEKIVSAGGIVEGDEP